MQPFRSTAVLVLLFLAGNFQRVHAEEQSCRDELGSKAAKLVWHCSQVSGAFNPLCNRSKPCKLIEEEIARGCEDLLDYKDAGTEFCSPYIKQQDASAPPPAGAAQCFLQVNGVYYLGGDCLFTPLDAKGSFRITASEGLAVEVKVKADHEGNASWSGPRGGAATMPIGAIASDGRGCWEDDGIPSKTHVCAWGKRRRLYLGPTPQEPKWSLAWGEREGMYARIISSSGLDTEQAVVIAEKDRDGAVIGCRGNHDYSLGCIDWMMEDDSAHGAAPTKATLQGNCKTKIYTDFWGRKLEHLGDDIRDLASGELLGYSMAANSDLALSAFKALCPRTAKSTASPQ